LLLAELLNESAQPLRPDGAKGGPWQRRMRELVLYLDRVVRTSLARICEAGFSGRGGVFRSDRLRASITPASHARQLVGSNPEILHTSSNEESTTWNELDCLELATNPSIPVNATIKRF
jgi:hypothetical protein